jgi:hypothetical protein
MAFYDEKMTRPMQGGFPDMSPSSIAYKVLDNMDGEGLRADGRWCSGRYRV